LLRDLTYSVGSFNGKQLLTDAVQEVDASLEERSAEPTNN